MPAVRLLMLTGIFALILFTCAAAAADDLASQRSRFLEAETSLKSGDLNRYRVLRDSLEQYPLYPYLVYRDLRGRLARANPSEVEQYLSEYADTPLPGRLRNHWLRALAGQARWPEYLRAWRPTGDTSMQCAHLQALVATGQAEAAFELVTPLWLSGKSQPDACDPIFKAWREAGRLTPQLVWERIELAMAHRQVKLAKYLRRYLPAQDRAWLDTWLQIHRNPDTILHPTRFAKLHPRRSSMLMHGMKRLVSRDPVAAARAWSTLMARYEFSLEQQAAIENKLALAMMRGRHPGALEQFNRIEPCTDNERLQGTRIITAMIGGDWEQALHWMDSLPEAAHGSERWRYWRARALAKLGYESEAENLFRGIAGERSYYGYLAADRVGADYRLGHRRLDVPPATLARVEQLSGIERARELHHFDRMSDAGREWRMATRELGEDELKAAARLAESWGWHYQAIFTLARTGYWDDLELRFPILHRRQIERMAQNRQLDTAWVFAVLRQESAFNAGARSHAGARGLMQLMPRTAKHVAKTLRQPAPKLRDLYDPDTNIRLGTAYLREVLDRLDQHPVLAIAAYNAGPHRVEKWLPERALPADLWVETVPFNETRTYLRRVLYYTAIYEHRLGQTPTRLAQRMGTIRDFRTRAAGDQQVASETVKSAG